MGNACGTIKHDVGSFDASNTGLGRKIINHCSPLEPRLDFSKKPTDLKISGNAVEYTASYVYVSQRGFYPMAAGKANQDSYVVYENIAGDKDCHLFGVFDGHGEEGDKCSHYSANLLPNMIEDEINKSELGTTKIFEQSHKEMKKIYKNAFVRTNNMLHDDDSVESYLSGTTGITVMIKGDKLFVGNVGDSRAIIASEQVPGQLKSSPLSSDQTPFRKDERERLKKKGAKIMTFEQIEGNEPMHEDWGTVLGEELDDMGDPPRVWDATLEKPGCAFTRSLGDMVAETVGVYAEPEVLVWNIEPHDRFIVIASDGVFEFITSQSVVDILATSTPATRLEAAKKVVSDSYNLWLTYDDRTDDITIIVIDLLDIKKKQSAAMNTATVSPEVEVDGDSFVRVESIASKPVRKAMSKAKRALITEQFTTNEKDEDFDIEAHATEKDPADIERISGMVESNFMFRNLNPQQRHNVFRMMKLVQVEEGQRVIKEGDPGEEMYIIDQGEFTVHKRDENGMNQVVYTYTTAGATFGEQSLMYGKPRGASIKAKTKGKLWSISRKAYRAVMAPKRVATAILSILVTFFPKILVTKLQPLAIESIEVEIKDSSSNILSLLNNDWCFVAVVSGVLTAGDMVKKVGSIVLRKELEAKGDSITSSSNCRLATFTNAQINKTIGSEWMTHLNQSSDLSGFNVDDIIVTDSFIEKSKKSIITNKNIDSGHLQQIVNTGKLVSGIGETGFYVTAVPGTASLIDTKSVTLRVINKKMCLTNNMSNQISQELQLLKALNATSENSKESNKDHSVKLAWISEDEKFSYIAYKSVFLCDLSTITGMVNDIEKDYRVYFAKCVTEAITYLHTKGIVHRFVQPSSFMLTSEGTIKLCDLRYSRLLTGSRIFTICGDPLYFPPEVVSQTGYDHSIDLWALGCTLIDLLEGENNNPFGNSDTNETEVFKQVTSFSPSKLSLKRAEDKDVDLIKALLQPQPQERLGYLDHKDLLNHNLFKNCTLTSAKLDIDIHQDEAVRKQVLDVSEATNDKLFPKF